MGITDRDRSTLLRAAMANVGRDGLKEALARPAPELSPVPKAAANALNALRRHGDPAAVVDRPQYRAALPYLAALGLPRPAWPGPSRCSVSTPTTPPGSSSSTQSNSSATRSRTSPSG